MQHLKYYLLLLLVGVVSLCNGKIMYKDCGSTGVVKMVDLSPCPKEPCVLKFNTNVSLKIDFMTKMATKELTAIMMGIIEGTPIPQPLPDPNACDSGVKCPIMAGAENIFSQIIYIEPDFPIANLTAQIELKDDDGNSVTCVQIKVDITE